jgi:hypothetical protein
MTKKQGLMRRSSTLTIPLTLCFVGVLVGELIGQGARHDWNRG